MNFVVNTSVAMAHCLHEACYLNNEGVIALTSGRKGNELAIVAFRKSLRLLENLVSRVGDDSAGLEAVNDLAVYNAKEVPEFSDETFYVCDQPKVFCPKYEDASCITRVTAFSATVIFNLAIAYHRQAFLTSVSKHVLSAQKLYKACAQLCSSLITSNPINQTILSLYVACVNNLAHAHRWLLERTDLEANLSFLQHLMAQVSRVPENTKELQQISMNIVLWSEHHSAAAAA